MQRILQDNNHYVVSGRRGEELLYGIKKFAEENRIESAAFTAIGAVEEVELAWYDIGAKQYVRAVFQEDLELVSLVGNVSKKGEETIVHCHGVFSDKAMAVKGGHVMRAVISGACEISLDRMEGTMTRAYDDETGLNLLR